MKKVLCCMIIITLLCGSAFAEGKDQSFGDMLYELGLISGTGDGDLSENQTLTREEMVTILWKLSTNSSDEFTPPSTPTFEDVPKDHWAYGIIEHAYAIGLTSGVDDNHFGLGDEVTYQQAITFVMIALGNEVNWDSVINDAYFQYDIYPDEAVSAPVLLRKHIFEMLSKALLSEHKQGDLLINQTDRFTDTSKDAYKASYDAYYEPELAPTDYVFVRESLEMPPVSDVRDTEDHLEMYDLEFSKRLKQTDLVDSLWNVDYTNITYAQFKEATGELLDIKILDTEPTYNYDKTLVSCLNGIVGLEIKKETGELYYYRKWLNGSRQGAYGESMHAMAEIRDYGNGIYAAIFREKYGDPNNLSCILLSFDENKSFREGFFHFSQVITYFDDPSEARELDENWTQ